MSAFALDLEPKCREPLMPRREPVLRRLPEHHGLPARVHVVCVCGLHAGAVGLFGEDEEEGGATGRDAFGVEQGEERGDLGGEGGAVVGGAAAVERDAVGEGVQVARDGGGRGEEGGKVVVGDGRVVEFGSRAAVGEEGGHGVDVACEAYWRLPVAIGGVRVDVPSLSMGAVVGDIGILHGLCLDGEV